MTQRAKRIGIKGLEEELEQPLFDRSSRPFSLTPRGKRLREEVEPLVTGFEALMGYLYLTEQFDRMAELLGKGLEQMGELISL